MIGPKKLSTIRQELKRALTTTSADPIRWLARRMAAPERRPAAVGGKSEVLKSLCRFLEAPRTRKRRKQRVSTNR